MVMRSLRWASIAASLVMGVIFLAPGLSEAGVPKVTIYWGTTAKPVPVSATNSCSTEERTAGYTHCYRITTGTYTFSTGVSATITDYSSTKLAKVLIADTSSNANTDLMTLSGLIITPPLQKSTCTDTTNSTSCTQLKIKFEARFDVSNPVSNIYKAALRIGGSMSANANVSPFNQNDWIKIEGTGNFNGTTRSIDSRVWKEISINPIVSLSTKLQTPTPYPTFTCNNGNNGCTPYITQTLTWVPRLGQDRLNLPNSGDIAFGGSTKEECNLNAPDPGGPPGGTPADPCMKEAEKIEKRIKDLFTRLADEDENANRLLGAAKPKPCSEPDCATDKDPVTAITIRKTIHCGADCSTLYPPSRTFTFNIYFQNDELPAYTASIEMEGGNGTPSDPYVETRELTVPVNAGTYRITEYSDSVWSQGTPTCTNYAGGEAGGGETAEFTASATCDFTNDFSFYGEID